MRLLMLTESFNSLAQRLWVELESAGHELSVEFDINDSVTRQAVELWQPEVLVAPLLRRAIPGDVFARTPCLIVHPGPPGDRGPAALDRAILDGRERWAVSVIEATAELDAGPLWAWRDFPLRQASKSSIYRREVVSAASEAIVEALARMASGSGSKRRRNLGPMRPNLRTDERLIDWSRHTTSEVIRRINSADSQPGLVDQYHGQTLRLHDAWPARPRGNPGPAGDWIGHTDQALLRATVDGAVWIGHLQVPLAGSQRRIKLPAITALAHLGLKPPPALALSGAPGQVEVAHFGNIVSIRFPFLNGAMNPAGCHALEQAIRTAVAGPAKVIVLLGGRDFWSNGIDLATIEAADSPADASWQAINAIDDVCLAMLERSGKWLIAALTGNAGAGGVFMALAADQVIARDAVILNPHYRNMGNLYGSEYWTYLLPARLGQAAAQRLMSSRLPIGAAQAVRIGLIDEVVPGGIEEFERAVIARAQSLADSEDLPERVARRNRRRAAAEQRCGLYDYRRAELERMRLNFYGFDTSYHVARHDFITKTPKSRTPLYLARHRRLA